MWERKLWCPLQSRVGQSHILHKSHLKTNQPAQWAHTWGSSQTCLTGHMQHYQYVDLLWFGAVSVAVTENCIFVQMTLKCWCIPQSQPSEMVGLKKNRICVKFCFNLESTASEAYAVFKKYLSWWCHKNNIKLWMVFKFQKQQIFGWGFWTFRSPTVKLEWWKCGESVSGSPCEQTV